VRRVAAQEITAPDELLFFERRQQVAQAHGHAAAEAEESDIALGERYRLGEQVRRIHARLGLVIRIGEREVAAAGADVYHRDIAAFARHAVDLGERSASQDLGLLARDQRL